MQLSDEHRLIERFERGDHKAMVLLADHDIDGLLRVVIRITSPLKHGPLICQLFSRPSDDFVIYQPS